MASALESMNANHLGMGLMVVGAGIMATSFIPSATPLSIAPPGTPQAATLIGGAALAGLGTALTLIQPPK